MTENKALIIFTVIVLLSACIFAQAHAASCYTVNGKTICGNDQSFVTCTRVNNTTTCTED